MNDKPLPPDDSYEVMLGKDVPVPCPRSGVKMLYDEIWVDSLYNKGAQLQNKHPMDYPMDSSGWYAVPKSALPAKEPEKPTPQPDADGWIPHTPGDPCPCDNLDQLIDLKLRGGWVTKDYPADKVRWTDLNTVYDIFAWRPHKPAPETPKETALSSQIGGDHYKSCAIQPIEFITANNLGFCEGNIVKYVTRHASKNGKQDLLKAKHYIDLLIQLKYPEA